MNALIKFLWIMNDKNSCWFPWTVNGIFFFIMDCKWQNYFLGTQDQTSQHAPSPIREWAIMYIMPWLQCLMPCYSQTKPFVNYMDNKELLRNRYWGGGIWLNTDFPLASDHTYSLLVWSNLRTRLDFEQIWLNPISKSSTSSDPSIQ